jgi:hydrogenase maturation protease
MSAKLVEEIANAVLYEGYLLYPYRPSAVKNRQRWNFGVVYPKAYCETPAGADSWLMRTECLIRGSASGAVDVKVLFLQAVSRQLGRPTGTVEPDNSEPDLEIVESLEIGKKIFQSWQEAIERDVILPPARLADLLLAPVSLDFVAAGGRELEPVNDDSGSIAAYIVRTREPISGNVELRAEKRGADLFKLTVVISNLTPLENARSMPREDVLPASLLSAHTILSVTGGEFVSLMDPPSELRQIASECKNAGTWPVLVGEDGCKSMMLSSPIILYDYPQIAPESAGDLFDATEIDEILALRILTLSDDEKREIRQTDERAREVLERTETMPMEQFLKLHGALRGMRPAAGGAFDTPAREDDR